MTLADVLPRLPLSYDEGKLYGLVFSSDLADRLSAVQAESPERLNAKPVPLRDGRFALCGDLLSEVGPGGLYASAFARLDSQRFGEIAVMPIADVVSLLPADPVEV